MTASKPLLVDYMVFNVTPQQINESLSKNGGRLLVQGTLQRANATNQNKRRYPKPILMREAKKYNDQFILDRRALGELDHPDSSVVNLNNVSHNIVEIHWDGDDLIGTVEVLSTPAGNILKELFKAGIKLGISSRGLGSVKEISEGILEVQDDFEIIAWDFVSNPSTHGAFLKPTSKIQESVERKIEDKYSNVNRLITEIISEF